MGINKDNYKDWLIRYFEHDLTIAEKAETEQFIKENEWASQELNLLKRTKLKPDMEIRFPDKRLLFRTEEPVVELKKPVVVFKMYRYAALAAAAAFLAFAVIISIRKTGNRTETARSNVHTNVHTNIIPQEKQLENPQALVAPQSDKVLVPSNVQTNTSVQKHSPEKKNLMANETKPVTNEETQQPVQEKKTPVQADQPVKNDNYATNKLPVEKPADIHPDNQVKEVVQEPTKQVAVVKKSEPSIPSRYASYGYGEDKSTLQSLLDLVRKVSIKKHVEDQQTYYALSIETPDIKINKTIK
jgi:hypothetical protein